MLPIIDSFNHWGHSDWLWRNGKKIREKRNYSYKSQNRLQVKSCKKKKNKNINYIMIKRIEQYRNLTINIHTPILAGDFSTDTWQDRSEWNDIFKVNNWRGALVVQLGVCIQLRSWCHSLWVWAPRWVLCWQLRT